MNDTFLGNPRVSIILPLRVGVRSSNPGLTTCGESDTKVNPFSFYLIYMRACQSSMLGPVFLILDFLPLERCKFELLVVCRAHRITVARAEFNS
jgi:hypothetical protein